MSTKIGMFLVMLGALSLSFHGQVEAAGPLLGTPMSVVLALTNDVASMCALAEVLSPEASKEAKRWAWVVLVLAGGTALALNTWDAIRGGSLPLPFAVLVGAGPVVLAWVLSHVVALRVSADRPTPPATALAPVPVRPHRPVTPPSAQRPALPGGGAANPGSTPVPPPRTQQPRIQSSSAPAAITAAPRPPATTASATAPATGPKEITPQLIADGRAADQQADRGRAGYRVLKDQLGITEALARDLRTHLDNNPAPPSNGSPSGPARPATPAAVHRDVATAGARGTGAD